jgi:HAD superfamily hydrolase (TIGR01509 family)
MDSNINILIPLCGKGERFLSKGILTPKPLIKVLGKEILSYVLDSLKLSSFQNVYVITNNRLISSNLDTFLSQHYPGITILNLKKETRGPAETIFLATQHISNEYPCLLVDGDNFYTTDIICEIQKNPSLNQVICFETFSEKPVFSYVDFDKDYTICSIAEKEKISNFANTGAYYFNSTSYLAKCTSMAIDRIHDKEPYISHAIHFGLQESLWKATPIPSTSYFSLGTPEQVDLYTQRTLGFLFDLDGTIVNTDEIYFKVWQAILKEYNIHLTKDIYYSYIYSNSDSIVKDTLLANVSCTLSEVSSKKDELFLDYIDSVQIISNAKEFIQQRQKEAHKVAVVTNSNRKNATAILNHIGIHPDILVIGEECTSPKPHPAPYLKAIEAFSIAPSSCYIFEDSKNGITSAKGANVKCIVGISNPFNSIEYSGADIVFSDYTFPIESILSFKPQSTDYSKIIQFSLQNKYSVDTIHVHPIQLKGGFIADVLAVKVTLDGVPRNTIIKLINNNNSELNKMAHFLNLYERELYFYETIAPFVPIHVPKCLGILRNTSYEPIGFMLEDMRNTAVLNKNLDTEPVELSLSIVSNMANLHASFWNQNLQTKFKDLKKHNDSLYQPAWQNFLSSRLDIFLEKWKSILSPSDIELTKEIVSSYSTIQNELSTPPLTLCHGDIKSPNIFYKESTPFFIDWQYISNGKGTQDLVFFMIESFSKEKIKILYPLFKNFYYTKLMEFGVKGYSFKEYEADILNSMFYFPLFVAIWFGTTPTSDLIDLNFPYFFIQKLFSFYHLVLKNPTPETS